MKYLLWRERIKFRCDVYPFQVFLFLCQLYCKCIIKIYRYFPKIYCKCLLFFMKKYTYVFTVYSISVSINTKNDVTDKATKHTNELAKNRAKSLTSGN